MSKIGYEPMIVKEDGAYWRTVMWEGRMIREFHPLRVVMDTGQLTLEIYLNKHWYWYPEGVRVEFIPADFPTDYLGRLMKSGEITWTINNHDYNQSKPAPSD